MRLQRQKKQDPETLHMWPPFMSLDHVASDHSLSGRHAIVPELLGTLTGLRRRGTEGECDDQGPQEHLFFLRNYRSIYNHLVFGRFLFSSCITTFVWTARKGYFFSFPMCTCVIRLFMIIFLNNLYLEA